MKTLIFLLLSLMCNGYMRAEGGKGWLGSVGMLVAAHTMDTVSSWGKPEGNPLLRDGGGRFGWRGAVVKWGVLAGGIEMQRRTPKMRKVWMVVNVGVSVGIGMVARNNWRNSR